MRAYFIRHCQSEANLRKIHSGWAQVSLTELGVYQAKKAGEYLKDIAFDKVYSSDLIRAMQTAENALPGCVYETDSLLRERNVGEVTGKSKDICYKEYGEVYMTSRNALDYTPFGGENEEMLRERAERFIRKLGQCDYENVAVFTHEAFLRNILGVVMNVQIPVGKILLDNCTVAIIEYIDRAWKLISLNQMS